MANYTRRKVLIGSFMICFMICLFAIPFSINSAFSFSTEAPPGYCGAPGDGYVTCRVCHTGPSANYINGAIVSDIPPSGYVPGTTYNVSAKIKRPGHVRFGFEVSPQDSIGNQIGTMSDLGPETTFAGFGKYITHSSYGTFNSDSAIWYFQWIAPPAGTGPFTFWGTFNATDNNGSNVNDTIFRSELFITEDIAASIASAQNPFSNVVVTENNSSNQIGISFQTFEAHALLISLYDLQGKFIGDLYNDIFENNEFNKNLNLPSIESNGIYLLNIQNGNYHYSKKIFLSKN